MLKQGGYRSAPMFIGAAKEEHIALGFSWTNVLELEHRRFTKSTLRGLGPARQPEALNLTKLIGLTFELTPLLVGGPMGTANLVVLSTLFMLREIEGAFACRFHITFKLGPPSHDMAPSSIEKRPHGKGVRAIVGLPLCDDRRGRLPFSRSCTASQTSRLIISRARGRSLSLILPGLPWEYCYRLGHGRSCRTPRRQNRGAFTFSHRSETLRATLVEVEWGHVFSSYPNGVV